MTKLLDKKADVAVQEMIRLGAKFEISAGPAGPVWFYSALPSKREALRRYKAELELDRPGFNAAMTLAVMRSKYPSAP